MRISKKGKTFVTLGSLLILCILILFICEQKRDRHSRGEEDDKNIIIGKIIEVRDTSILLLHKGDVNKGLMDAGIKNVKIYSQNKQEIKADALKPGMCIRLLLQDGSAVMERYPLLISGVQEVHVLEQENDYIGLYLDIIKEIYGRDSALNDGMRVMALDLTQVKNLTDSEKEVVRYLLEPLLEAWQENSVGSPGTVKCQNPDVILATEEELREKGMLGEDGSYFAEGILIKIRTIKNRKNSFTFSAEKWCSGLAANGYDDCKASFKEGVGTYELNFTWIS